MTSTTIYYIYAYIRNKDSSKGKAGTPYYIGKGKGKRATAKHSKGISVPKDKNFIVFMETNLTDIGSLALERRYIKWYGRIDKNTGCLHNRTDGGEGSSGRACSSETANKISASNLGKSKQFTEKYLAELTIRMTGDSNPAKQSGIGEKISLATTGKKKNISPEQKLLNSERRRLHRATDETKTKMSNSRKGKLRFVNPITRHKVFCLIGLEPEGYYKWSNAHGFCDKDLKLQYPKYLLFPKE